MNDGLLDSSLPLEKNHSLNQQQKSALVEKFEEKQETQLQRTEEEETIYLEDDSNSTTTTSLEPQQFQISNSNSSQNENQKTSQESISGSGSNLQTNSSTTIDSQPSQTSEEIATNEADLGLSFPELQEESTQFEVFRDSSEVFMKNNFTSLEEKFLPCTQTNPNRLSLSTLYLKKITPSVVAPSTTETNVSSLTNERTVTQEPSSTQSTDSRQPNCLLTASPIVTTQNQTPPNEILPVSKSSSLVETGSSEPQLTSSNTSILTTNNSSTVRFGIVLVFFFDVS